MCSDVAQPFPGFPVEDVARWAATQIESDEKKWENSDKVRLLQKERIEGQELRKRIMKSLGVVRSLSDPLSFSKSCRLLNGRS